MNVVSAAPLAAFPVYGQYICTGLLIVVCGVAYIVGGRKEEMRQLQLQRQSETMEKIEKFRSGKRSQEYAERKGEKKQ